MKPEEIFDTLRKQFSDSALLDFDGTVKSPFICVAPDHFTSVMRFLRDAPGLAFDYLQLITAVDWIGYFEVVYHLYSMKQGHKIAVKVKVPRENPVIPSVTSLWPAADWHEREQYDLMGVIFEGHPDLRRILCPEDWEGHPLRKDYVQPVEYHGISNVRQARDDWYPKPDEDAKAIITKPPQLKSPPSSTASPGSKNP